MVERRGGTQRGRGGVPGRGHVAEKEGEQEAEVQEVGSGKAQGWGLSRPEGFFQNINRIDTHPNFQNFNLSDIGFTF